MGEKFYVRFKYGYSTQAINSIREEFFNWQKIIFVNFRTFWGFGKKNFTKENFNGGTWKRVVKT